MGEPEPIESLVALFGALEDPRVDRTKGFSLEEILFLVLAAVVSGVNHLTRIEDFGNYKLDWLRTVLPYENGIPSHDTIGRVLGMLDPDALEVLFTRWMSNVAKNVEGVVAIDGKTLRGAIRRGDKKSFVHMVSAFGSANGLVYGSVKVREKSNEIEAMPRLLELLYLEGALVTIDAMGCQTDVMEKIVERGGDFLITVKANQPTLGGDLDVAFHDIDIRGGADFDSVCELEKPAHGRGEWRRCEVLASDGHISNDEKWKHVRSLIRITYERRLDGDVTTDTRYFVSSLADLDANRALEVARAHWSIENQLHWTLDVAFREDECRVWANNAAENLVVLRHVALNLLRSAKGMRGGIAARRQAAGYSDEARVQVMTAGLG